ncbi:IclR family transcriptional regulator [Pusillimonas sp. NJUB218]|uniref:IclR family transcriptional regulator n=1 Tax=Pusillimonas sp. NJUB218 TaxID=2023230 RepID=UPI000F4BDC16|nr:IclR family transcriptional regulator [Pusillimonas sp. NJUB218]ROT45367.1 IclR family transcriptional regulator [Pusillimonas sp. NJUB218]
MAAIEPLTIGQAAETDKTEKYSVPGLERGLRILAEFSRQTPTLTAPDLARRLQVPRTTVFRLLVTLENLGFVERLNNGRDYQLGTAVLRLGFEYLASLSITDLSRPILERLRNETGYSSNLVIRDARDIVYVQKVAPSSVFSSSVHIGTRLPAHATVLGRVLLSHHTLDQLQRLYPEERLQAHGPNTPATVHDLFRLLQTDKERGYVLEEGFFESNISTIAAPVFDDTGKVTAALGLTVPAVHIPDVDRDILIAKVVSAARELSMSLNARNI